jgi:hypothetical protein
MSHTEPDRYFVGGFRSRSPWWPYAPYQLPPPLGILRFTNNSASLGPRVPLARILQGVELTPDDDVQVRRGRWISKYWTIRIESPRIGKARFWTRKPLIVMQEFRLRGFNVDV